MDKILTTEEGIAIQQQQLAQWKTVLNPEAFQKLKEYAEAGNSTAINGFRVTRGSDLSCFVTNLGIANMNSKK